MNGTILKENIILKYQYFNNVPVRLKILGKLFYFIKLLVQSIYHLTYLFYIECHRFLLHYRQYHYHLLLYRIWFRKINAKSFELY